VLSGVSTIKLKEIRHQTAADGGKPEFVAHVEVLGRPHAVACKVNANARTEDLRSILEKMCEDARELSENATAVLFAPYLSPESQAMCKQRSAGFFDLEGNARIALGEVFIVKRTMPQRVQERALDPVLLQEALARPTAPAIYIASNIPGAPNRVRENALAGIATA
jgi:hypothetical protein